MATDSIPDHLRQRDDQLTRDDVRELARTDPAALGRAREDGRLRDLLAGREPGSAPVCPTCGRATA